MTTSANKVLRLRVVISAKDYKRYREHYSDRDIRSIVSQAGEEELERLVQDREDYPSTTPKAVSPEDK